VVLAMWKAIQFAFQPKSVVLFEWKAVHFAFQPTSVVLVMWKAIQFAFQPTNAVLDMRKAMHFDFATNERGPGDVESDTVRVPANERGKRYILLSNQRAVHFAFHIVESGTIRFPANERGLVVRKALHFAFQPTSVVNGTFCFPTDERGPGEV